MRLKYIGALGAILMNVSIAAQVPSQEGSILIHTNDLPRVELTSFSAMGHVDDKQIDISFQRVVDNSIPTLQVYATIGDLKLGKFTIALDKLPDLESKVRDTMDVYRANA
jgi:hypothetical protein